MQKIYPVGPFIVAAFSGSVEFGLWAVENLRRSLVAPPDAAWIPGKVAFRWYRRARWMFARQPNAITDLGSSIMLLGSSPIADIGIPGYARPTVAVLRSPDFFPAILPIDTVDSIGVGRMVDVYAQELRRLNGDVNLLQMEAAAPGGYAVVLQMMIQRVIEDHPQAAVSPHLHYCLVRRRHIQFGTSDRTVVRGEVWTEVRMPEVATSWAEFRRMTEAVVGADAGAASC